MEKPKRKMSPNSLANLNPKYLKKRVYDSEWVPKPLSVPIEKKFTTRVARPIPVEIEEQNEVANAMYQWQLDHPHERSLDRFCTSNGYRPYKLYKLREKNEYFADVLHICMSNIMSNMGDAIWHQEGDAKMYDNTLRQWHEIHKETMRHEVVQRIEASAAVAAKATTGATVYNVIDIEMDKVERTEAVTKSLEKHGKKRNELGTGRRDENVAQEVPTTVVSVTVDGRN